MERRYRHRRRRRGRGCALLLLFLSLAALVLAGFLWLNGGDGQPQGHAAGESAGGLLLPTPKDSSASATPAPTPQVTAEPTPTPTPAPVDFTVSLHSPNAVLTRLSDGVVLMRKAQDQPIAPASLTKIMTALIALENLGEETRLIRVPEDIFPELYAANASMAGFSPGEHIRAIDLVYGCLLPSGADASLALARNIAGSEAAYVALMNERAAGLGMTGTHFDNVTGLHGEDHYTTVGDMALLLRAALDNPAFREAFTAARYSMPPSDGHADGITVHSTLVKRAQTLELDGGKILGGKTGFTSQAGLCLASLAQVDGQEYVLVTAGAEGSAQSEPFHILDAIAVYNGCL